MIPFPHIWASTRPFGTPGGPIVLKWVFTMIVLLAIPFGDAFNFIVDLRSYPDSLFLFLMVVGIYYIRYRRHKEGLPQATFQAWHSALIFSALVCLFILIMPWYPPDEADVSFWYGTYCAVGIGLIVGMVGYYYLWIKILPELRGYKIRPETVLNDQDGSVTHRLRRVPNAEVQQWDRTHDDAGNVLLEATADGARAEGNIHLLKRVKVQDAATPDYATEPKA